MQRPDAIRLLHVFLYVDKAPVRRINWCTAIIVLYAAFLLLKALAAVFVWPQQYY